MNITKLKLENFRNYDSQEIEFNKGINVIYGDKAQGKTNILEANFLCSMGKSFRTSKDKELIKINKDFAKLNIEYEKSDREGKIEYIISEKKSIAINGVKIKKLSELLGNINSIIFSPDDMEILKDGPQKRRKFLNMLISQLRPRYLFNLNAYNKTLEQRNNYLRQIKELNKKDVEKLIDYRKISIDVIWWEYEGLKVPKSAIIYDNGLSYIVRNRGGYLSKILVKIRKEGENYCIVSNYDSKELKELGFTTAQINNMRQVTIYDEIILNPDLKNVE